jgi:hypothetical protein
MDPWTFIANGHARIIALGASSATPNAQRRLLDCMIAERNCFIEAAGAAADGTVSPAR